MGVSRRRWGERRRATKRRPLSRVKCRRSEQFWLVIVWWAGESWWWWREGAAIAAVVIDRVVVDECKLVSAS